MARSSFQAVFSLNKTLNNVTWSAVPMATLYDVENITAAWADLGVTVWNTPDILELPDLSDLSSAYPRFVQSNRASDCREQGQM